MAADGGSVRGLPRGMPPPRAATAGGRAPARRLIYTIETTKAAPAGFYSRFDIFSRNSSNFWQKKRTATRLCAIMKILQIIIKG